MEGRVLHVQTCLRLTTFESGYLILGESSHLLLCLSSGVWQTIYRGASARHHSSLSKWTSAPDVEVKEGTHGVC